METKTTRVFYGRDALPYKDKQREVHFPNVGTVFCGENNVTEIRFFVDRIGTTNNVTWIANIKKPNGQIVYRILANSGVEEEESYVVLDISDLYTELKGAVVIGLQGYSGTINITEDDGEYEISGTPDILTTGVIQVMVNYAPLVLPSGTTLSETAEQQILAALSQKVSVNNVIATVLNKATEDITGYQNGQIIYCKTNNLFYIKANNQWEQLPIDIGEMYIGDKTLNELLEEAGKVKSVNGKVGEVVLSASDISATNTQTIQQNLNRMDEEIDAIVDKIPSGTSAQNQLTNENQVRGWINDNTGYLLSKNAQGDYFSDHAELVNATTFYCSGVVRTPTRNDITYVLSDELHDHATTKYRYQNGQFDFEIVVNETPLTQAQLNAINSGITEEKRESYDNHIADNDIHLDKGQNGYYENLQVGIADNLKSTIGTTDTSKFAPIRTSGGNADISTGFADIKKLIGNSVVFNQKYNISPSRTETSGGITFVFDATNKKITANGTANSNVNFNLFTINDTTYKNHILLIKGCASGGSENTYSIYDNNTGSYRDIGNGDVSKTNLEYVRTVAISIKQGTVCSNLVFRPQIIDFTLMFGNNDNIPSKYLGENGALEFAKDYPNSYYDYNEGEIISSKVSSYKVVGRNALKPFNSFTKGTLQSWDGVKNGTEALDVSKYYVGLTVVGYYDEGYIPSPQITQNGFSYTSTSGGYGLAFPVRVIGGQTYRVELTDNNGNLVEIRVMEVDENGYKINSSSSWPATTFVGQLDNRTRYIYIIPTGSANTEINVSNVNVQLQHSGSLTGYVPHEEYEYEMGNDTLRGVGSVGDEKLPNGTITRKFGIVDLGTLNWGVSTDFASANVADLGIKYSSGNQFAIHNCLCSKYQNSTGNDCYSSVVDKAFGIVGDLNALYVRDSALSGYTDAQFKQAMSGVYLIYELATPTTEQGTPYESQTRIDDYGTQEFIEEDLSVQVPSGAEILYKINIHDFIQRLYLHCGGDVSKIVLDED